MATWVLPKHRWVAIELVALLAFLASLLDAAEVSGGIAIVGVADQTVTHIPILVK